MEIKTYPPEIRKVPYTINAIESVNVSLWKLTRKRGSFPSDEALTKLLYSPAQHQPVGADAILTS